MAIIGVLGLVFFSLLVIKTNLELFKDIQSYRKFMEVSEQKLMVEMEKRDYWQNRYQRTVESWLEWQIKSELKGKVTNIESIELGKNYSGIAYVTEGKIEKRYSFQIVFDRNNIALLTDLKPM
ncbi:hypothetical protein COU88_04280 [Candidatus Roizmanbacteria bacterium CG10_big_fil_rev_8_21_14_0_10_39_6]|uniref:Uncharacterized protein n=1 Tax=Candidatus Roizmanbacteria bacterium CG10_big_fil_rev_8_21_14_0_10_39_6 TaxID=1974853 RepID=A0A2M8KRM1_9BACT|nr:MAG: hypothetical protein COU88_04280 [Candidatus Roizmanbacteria bacterium CG10_big_fil_rev_8_21_14_0_10_39_6]